MEPVLFIFKDKPWYIRHIQIKFIKFYKVEYFFLSQKLNLSRNQIIKLINKIIKKRNIKKTFFDLDYSSFIDTNFISNIESKKKIGVSFDTEENLEKIEKTLPAFTHLLSAEPKYAKAFNSKKKSIFFPLETSEKIFHKIKIKKKYDIIFFGEAKGDRISYLNKIKQLKIKKKLIINSSNKNNNFELNKLINQSKIVLNFSKGISKYSKKNFDQFKGRILISGLAGTFCLSEYYKSSGYIFKKAFPYFTNSTNLLKTILELLNNKKKLNQVTKLFTKSCNFYSDKNYFKKIKKFLDEDNKFLKLELNFHEILNIIKISSKKNNVKVYIRNNFEILTELIKSKKLLNLLFFISTVLIGFIYFILNIKRNIKL